jgi:outer membrane lipoprotein-sorting protein
MTALLWLVAPAGADQKADALIAKATETARKAKSLQGELAGKSTVNGKTDAMSGSLRLLRPNMVRAVMKLPEPMGSQELICNGKSLYVVTPSRKHYLRFPAGAVEKLSGLGTAAAAFWAPQSFAADWTHRRHLGVENIEGRDYQVVEVRVGESPEPLKIYFGSSGLPEGMEASFVSDGKRTIQSIWLKRIRLDPPLTPADFAYEPPADFKKVE